MRLIKYLSLSIGALYETGASDTAYYSVDWTHPTRFIFTGGLTGHLGPIDVLAGMMGTPTNTTVVQDGAVLRGQTNPDITAGAVNNGIYTSGGFGFIVGVRGHFESLAPAKKPLQLEEKQTVPVEQMKPAAPDENSAPSAS